MIDKNSKPKLTIEEIVEKIANQKEIKFVGATKAEAIDFLKKKTNYFRISSYTKLFRRDSFDTRYPWLDFSHLIKLSQIEDFIREKCLEMCREIERTLKHYILRNVCDDESDDGYEIVKVFIDENPDILLDLVAVSSPYTDQIMNSYFEIEIDAEGKRSIKDYSNCPVWVFLELITFGKLISFYDYYCTKKGLKTIDIAMLKIVKGLRNACAHNNCIISGLRLENAKSPHSLKRELEKDNNIKRTGKNKTLKRPLICQLSSLFVVYYHLVCDGFEMQSGKAMYPLFEENAIKDYGFIKNSETIKASYDFAKECFIFFIKSVE